MGGQPRDPCVCVLQRFLPARQAAQSGAGWLLSEACPPGESEKLLVFPAMGTLSPATPLLYIFSFQNRSCNGSTPRRDWRGLRSHPGGSSPLGTRTVSVLDEDKVSAGRSWVLSLNCETGTCKCFCRLYRQDSSYSLGCGLEPAVAFRCCHCSCLMGFKSSSPPMGSKIFLKPSIAVSSLSFSISLPYLQSRINVLPSLPFPAVSD